MAAYMELQESRLISWPLSRIVKPFISKIFTLKIVKSRAIIQGFKAAIRLQESGFNGQSGFKEPQYLPFYYCLKQFVTFK